MTPVGLSLTLPQTEKSLHSKARIRALALETINSVRVTASDAAGNELAALISAARSGSSVSLHVEVPAGANRIFVVEIMDDNEKVLLLGSAVADLAPGVPVSLEIPVTPPLILNPQDAAVATGQVRTFQATLSPALLGLLVDPELNWTLEHSTGAADGLGKMEPPTAAGASNYHAPDQVPAGGEVILKVASRARPNIFETASLSILQARIVDRNRGIDQDGCGTERLPCQTLTQGLKLTAAGEIVLVKPGVYPFGGNGGEPTPLQMKPGVTLEGQIQDGQAAVLDFISPTNQNRIGILGAEEATIRGLTFQMQGRNFDSVIETNGTSLDILDNTFNSFCDDCIPIGVSVTAGGSPTLSGNRFGDFDSGGFDTALLIQDEATPIVEGNRFVGNFIGVQVRDAAQPDLGGGAMNSAGNNILSCNVEADLWNNSASALFAQGNQWDHQPPDVGFAIGNGIDIALSRLSGSDVDAANAVLYSETRCNFGITVSPDSGLVTTEDGGSATFTIVLNAAPTADVGIALSSSDPSEGRVFPANLVFTVENWHRPQGVTVTGVDDAIVDGDVPYTVIIAPFVSQDSHYTGYDPDDPNVINRDNDRIGITVSPTTGLITTEAGGTDSFTVVLDSQPSAPVTVRLSSSDTTEGTVLPVSLTFTAANWSQPQTVTVTGVDDAAVDGDIGYTIVIAPASSNDPDYNGFNPSDVAVTNRDNDVIRHRLTVRTVGSGTVTSTPDGINCGQAGEDCTEDYTAGTQVQLRAVADKSSIFSGWSGDCSGTGSTTSITMNGDKTCVATFTRVYIFKANFDTDVVAKPPNVNPPAQGDQVWDHLELNLSAGTILVQEKVGDLGNRPVVFDQAQGAIGGLRLSGFVERTPPSRGVYVARWRSLVNSKDAAFATIVLRDSEGLILASVDYRPSGILDFNNLNPEEGIGVPWFQDVSQAFEVIVDLDNRTVSLNINGLPVQGQQNLPFFQRTAADLARISMELGTTSAQAYGWDDIEIVVK